MSSKAIHFEDTGKGPLTLVFVHGWLGNCRWWDAQRDFFKASYRVITLDLSGHGQSTKDRKSYSVEGFAEDIASVIKEADAKNVVLIGHSMSGSNVVQAFGLCKDRLVGMVLVDTLHNLDEMMSYEQAKPFLDMVKADFKGLVMGEMSQHLFNPKSPKAVVDRVQSEFLSVPVDRALAVIEPFYRFDIRPAAKQVTVPVREIGTTGETQVSINRKYFADFEAARIADSGHYPMLEKSAEFNAVLKKILEELGTD